MRRLYDNFNKITNIYHQNVREGKRNFLARQIDKRMNTCFIGCLDSIEKKLGSLWGQGKHFSELTDREKQFSKIWKSLRNEILDKGNIQKRLLIDEFDNYENRRA